MFGDKVPDIVFDGAVNPKYMNANGTVRDDQKICIRNNGNVTFSNMDLLNKGKNKNSDLSKFDCSNPPVNEVKINL